MLKIVDVSQWNNITDYALLKESAEGLLIKSSQGIVEDPTFITKLSGAQKVGMRVGMWHFYHPDMAWKPQADKFLQIYDSLALKPRKIGLDCEESTWVETVEDDDVEGGMKQVKHTVLPHNPEEYSVWLANWLGEIEAKTQIIPDIYTRATWWDEWVLPNHSVVKGFTLPDWSRYPLWVAEYGANLSKPTLPRDWTNWSLWQQGTSVTPGIETPVDTDWFDGASEAEVDVLFGLASAPPTPPAPPAPVDPVVSERVLFKVMIKGAQNKRTGPGTNYPAVAMLAANDVVDVTEIAGDRCWFRDKDGNYFAGHYAGKDYVEIV